MSPPVQLYFFGSLQKRLRDLGEQPVEVGLAGPTPLLEVLERLKIPSDMVQLSMLNHKAVPKDSTVQPGDRLALFPIDYPIFVDWIDLRF
jgi:hypothetical protein